MTFTTLHTPEAVCFDLDNTLYEYAPCNAAGMQAVFAKLSTQLSIPQQDMRNYFDNARQQIKQQLGTTAASHSRLLYFQRMLELMGLQAQISLVLELEQTFWRTYLQNAKLYDGVIDFFYMLRKRNIPIALITDLTSQIQMRKLMYFDLDGLIDHLVTSEEAGADKPSPKIFELAISKLRISPNKILMLGDDLEKDVKGAEACGMRAIHLKGQNLSSFSAFKNIFN